MAIYSSILAQRIPWTEEPGRLHTAHVVTKSQTQLSNYHTYTERAYSRNRTVIFIFTYYLY